MKSVPPLTRENIDVFPFLVVLVSGSQDSHRLSIHITRCQAK